MPPKEQGKQSICANNVDQPDVLRSYAAGEIIDTVRPALRIRLLLGNAIPGSVALNDTTGDLKVKIIAQPKERGDPSG